MTKLHISESLLLPRDTVTSTLIVYGGKGTGKTNLAVVLAEELTKTGLRWSFLDPMGVAWGLRHSKDGKGLGIECLILGGAHGDIPIEPTGGAVVADLVADENVNVIIDFSRKPSGESWGVGEKIRFVTDYGKRLFQRQSSLVNGKRREPIFQILDEAARYIPQMIRAGQPELAMCVSVWAQIVEEARNAGIGVGLFTQRSARLNKDVAELADVMFAFRTVGPNSIAAVTDWLGEHVSKQVIHKHIETVRSLPVGRCLVVSPGWLQVEEVVQIRERETFDSSSTPKPGESTRRVTGKGAKPDLAKYADRMKETIERAKENDPSALKRTISELKRALEASGKQPVSVDPKAVEKAVQQAVAKQQQAFQKHIESLRRLLGNKQATVGKIAERLSGLAEEVRKLSFAWPEEVDLPKVQTFAGMKVISDPKIPRNEVELRDTTGNVGNVRFKVGPNSASIGNGDLPPITSSATRALGILCGWPSGLTEGMLAIQLGVKPRGGNWHTLKKALIGREFVVQNGDRFQITDEGREHAGFETKIANTTEEVLELWRPRLKGNASKAIDVIVSNPEGITKEGLASSLDVLPRGGNWHTILQELRESGLVIQYGDVLKPNKEALFL